MAQTLDGAKRQTPQKTRVLVALHGLATGESNKYALAQCHDRS